MILRNTTKCGIILYMTGIVGHSQILAFFDKILANGNLSHAYCFVGPSGVGKRAVAEFVAGKLFGVSSDKLKTQSDYTVVGRLFDEKTEKTKKDIIVDQMRDLRVILSRRSQVGGWKVAVVEDAEKMNLEAANALLKTLEEPKEKTVLFLLTEDEKQLPETIVSRCQLIYFHPVQKNELKKLALEKGLEESRADEMAENANGLPGQIIRWLNNDEEYRTYLSEVKRFQSLFKAPFFEKIKKVEELFGDKTDHIAARENLQNILNIWLAIVRESFKNNLWSPNRVLGVEKSIQDARKMLDQNIHPRLLIENILLLLP